MSRTVPLPRRLADLARWPVGIGLTSWRYMWRTTPMRRVVMKDQDLRIEPPSLPNDLDLSEVLLPHEGAGPLFHRRYRACIRKGTLRARDVMSRIQSDPNTVAPTEFARFHRIGGDSGRMRLGDEYIIRMPGPWNGPVRVVDTTANSFRFVTLKGHLEAGQIEFRAGDEVDLIFEIESWARSGDHLSHLMYDRLRMAKEIQLHMWTSTLERVVRLSEGVRRGPISIETSRIEFDG
jgi:Domain of unknown function (DUF1990)